MNPRTFSIETLGCKVNQHEGEAIRERLEALGLRDARPGEHADVAVINTCTVTSRADEKCRQRVRRAVRAHPGALVIVTGCGAAVDPDRYAAIPGVSRVLTKDRMVSLKAVLDGASPEAGDVFDLSVNRLAGHTRAFLKIQDGCNAFCSYCIVPRARGPLRSRPLSAIGDEARRLVESGHLEIVLTGIHLGLYGHDLAGVTLLDAVRETLKAPGLRRLRLSSIEAMEVSPALLDLFADDGRLCPHLHLPLQSGDDDVLRAMNRRYTAAQFLAVVDAIRGRLARPAVTTDVMVAFPGETEAQFENTLRVCRRAGFSRVHVFQYSPRPGTPAAGMSGRVPGGEAAARESLALELARRSALEYKKLFQGEVVEPLVEERRDRRTGMLTGVTERYLDVLFDGPEHFAGRIVPVRVTGVEPDALYGEPLPQCKGANP